MPRKKKSYPELDKVRHLLGTVPDANIAEMVGTSASIVGRYRRRYDIDAYQGYKFGHDDAKMQADAVIEQIEDEDTSVNEIEVPEAPASADAPAQAAAPAPRRSKIEPFRDNVGKLPDREIAEMAGVTPEAVRMFRRRNDIPLAARKPAASTKQASRKPRKRRSKLDPFSDLLGKVPDAEVAAMAGVTSENVRAYRRRHGIAAEWRDDNAAAKQVAQAPAPAPAAAVAAAPSPAPVAPAPAPAAAPATGAAQGFAVTVEGKDKEYFIVANDIAAASAGALKALPDAHITAVRHLGPAIR